MKSDQIFAEKCDFITLVNHPNKEFGEIKDVININFESIYRQDDHGAQHGLIANLVNERLKILRDSQVYLVNVSEIEGSYILAFALIIISSIGNYGAVRQGFEYLKDDILTIFKARLGPEYGVDVAYKVTEVTQKESKRQPNPFAFDIGTILNDKRWLPVVIIFTFIVIFISQIVRPKEEKAILPSETEKFVPFDEKRMEQMIDKKFDDYVKNRKIDMILERLILQPDTIPSKH